MDVHNLINSIVLSALTVAYFVQQDKLKIIKTISDLYQPEKLKQANEFIFEGKEYEYKSKLRTETEIISNKASVEFQKLHSEFADRYKELVDIPMNILIHKDKIEREVWLNKFPKNEKLLRELLLDYDNNPKKYRE
jgi:hypothetical protein